MNECVIAGAHTLGRSHCSSFSNRLNNFSTSSNQDPTLDPMLANQLRLQCPQGTTNPNLVVPMDPPSPALADTSYYRGLLMNRGLFTSDQTLLTNQQTRNQVFQNAQNLFLWRSKFAAAMGNMGKIGVMTGDDGQIRRNCRVING